MFRKMFSCVGLLLLGGAVVFVTPGLGQAQHGGGGHGGGHGGGGHFGGGHFGGAGGHFSGANHFSGGFRGGIHNGGIHYGGSHFGYDWNRYYHGGYGHYPNYGHHRHFDGRYGHYPYYGLYGGYPYYSYDYGSYPYLGSGAYDSGYGGIYGAETPSYGEGYTSSNPPAANYSPPVTGTVQPDPVAYVTVKVPADAKLWFDDTLTTSTGSIRQFDTPPLTPGSLYSYEVRATWNDNGHEVTQTQHVDVTAGAHISIGFPIPAKTAGEASAIKKG
jgi:uncharacterized protein (TIGR03000 family)